MALIAIVRTTYHGPTDTRGARISARYVDRFTGKRHTLTRARTFDLDPNEQRTEVARELIQRQYPDARLVGNDGDVYAFTLFAGND